MAERGGAKIDLVNRLPVQNFLYITRVKIQRIYTCMSSKLTLTLNKEVIEEAKKYASSNGQSLSEMVENYFKFLLDQKHIPKPATPSPRVEKLRGIIKVKLDFDYQKVLLEEIMHKHGA